MSFIDHKRQRCVRTYKTLEAKKYNNTKCILLHAKNIGDLPDEDKTFNDKTWLENSAELLGVNHVCLTVDKSFNEFSYNHKIPYYYNFLLNTEYEYVLISDSTDAVVTANPDDSIALLDYYKCDILYSSTHWWDYDYYTMPEQYKFNYGQYGTTYLNSGVCIGKTKTLIKLLNRVLDYAAFEPALYYTVNYRDRNGYLDWTQEQLAQFPKNCSDDQTIIRYLIKEFWPLVKVDNEFLLAEER